MLVHFASSSASESRKPAPHQPPSHTRPDRPLPRCTTKRQRREPFGGASARQIQAAERHLPHPVQAGWYPRPASAALARSSLCCARRCLSAAASAPSLGSRSVSSAFALPLARAAKAAFILNCRSRSLQPATNSLNVRQPSLSLSRLSQPSSKFLNRSFIQDRNTLTNRCPSSLCAMLAPAAAAVRLGGRSVLIARRAAASFSACS
mmetsp:Transcript_37537/g.90219  ORF Transcript_37537/g.90219 Transcript_37537/m.90219 type:complete len:206 (-) Transcript_37537:218-835(-)